MRSAEPAVWRVGPVVVLALLRRVAVGCERSARGVEGRVLLEPHFAMGRRVAGKPERENVDCTGHRRPHLLRRPQFFAPCRSARSDGFRCRARTVSAIAFTRVIPLRAVARSEAREMPSRCVSDIGTTCRVCLHSMPRLSETAARTIAIQPIGAARSSRKSIQLRFERPSRLFRYRFHEIGDRFLWNLYADLSI